jgi:hypothetical protein
MRGSISYFPWKWGYVIARHIPQEHSHGKALLLLPESCSPQVGQNSLMHLTFL